MLLHMDKQGTLNEELSDGEDCCASVIIQNCLEILNTSRWAQNYCPKIHEDKSKHCVL